MKRALVTVFIFLLMITGVVFSQDKSKITIAIMDFQNTSGKHELDYLQKAIPEMLITNLAKSGKLNIVERGRLQDAIREMELGMSGIVDQSKAVELGRAVGANAIIVGSFLEISHMIRINARLIDVKTSKVLKAESVQGRTGKEIFDLMDKLAQSIENKLLGKSKEQKIAKQKPTPQPTVTTPKSAPRHVPPKTPTVEKKKSNTMLYILGGAILIGGGVAAAMALSKKSEEEQPKPPANSDVSMTIIIPGF